LLLTNILIFYFLLFLALRALILKAQFETATDEASKQGILQELQSLLGESSAPDTGVQLAAAHIYLAAGLKKEALQCVHMGQTLEHMSLTLQLFVQLDRLDLAQNQCSLLRKTDEDSILTQLGGVYMALAKGSSVAGDAIHTLNQLSEQYGPSVFLLNLMACALMQQGKYSEAESKLEQSRQEFGSEDADTLVNLIVAYQYQSKSTDALVQQLKETYPDHFLAKGLEMVQGAFERESGKYQVAA
jgi:coatomer protein complex subunit epsilon